VFVFLPSARKAVCREFLTAPPGGKGAGLAANGEPRCGSPFPKRKAFGAAGRGGMDDRLPSLCLPGKP